MTRPTTLEDMHAASASLSTESGVKRGLAFRPRRSDVIIAPFAKNGTTWMQQIVHGLRTGGDMDFSEITEVVPWIEMAHDMGLDLDAPQKAHPRAFKSHLCWKDVPKGGRYIVVFRDPQDALVSLYRFSEGWFFEPGSISLADYTRDLIGHLGPGDWWDHAASWWRERERSEIQFFSYGAMKRDLARVVNQVADFINPDIDREARRVATKQAGFEFMKAHERQFDDHLLRELRDEACGLPRPEGGATKVSNGASGAGAELPEDVREAMVSRWRETMTAEFRFIDYSAFENAVDAHGGRG